MPIYALEATAGEVMSSPPIVVDETTSLKEAAGLMIENRIGCLPVVDEQGKMTGVVTERTFQVQIAGVKPSSALSPDRRVLEELYVAVRGGGATCNGRPIQVSATDRLDQALLATGFAYVRNEVEDNNVDHFNDLILEVRDIRRMGSAAVDFALVAAGRYDGFWELNLSPWDVAAGTLLVQEAGGRVTDVDGGKEMVEKGHFAATNGALHDTLLEVLARRRGKA